MLHFQCDCFYNGDKVQLITIDHCTGQVAFPAEWLDLWNPLPQLLRVTSPSHHRPEEADGPVSVCKCPYIFWMPDTNRSDGSVTTSKAKSINWARLSNPSGDCAFKRVHDRSGTLEEGKHTCSEIQLHQPHVTTRLSLQVWALVNTVSMEITAGEDSYAEILGG